MYCKTCGSKIVEGVSNCPICDAPYAYPAGSQMVSQGVSQPVASQATSQSASQTAEAGQSYIPFRTLGFTLLAIATVTYLIGMAENITFIGAYTIGTEVFYAGIAYPILLVIAFVVLLASAIVRFGLALRLGRSGAPRSWCLLGAVADIAFALPLIITLINYWFLNFFQIPSGMSEDVFYALSDNLWYLGLLLYLFAGVLYTIAGIAERKIGKPKIALILAGLTLAFNAIVCFNQYSILPITDSDVVFYLLVSLSDSLVFAGMLLVGFVLVGIEKSVNAATIARSHSAFGFTGNPPALMDYPSGPFYQ